MLCNCYGINADSCANLAISVFHAMTNKLHIFISGKQHFTNNLICTNAAEIFDPLLLPLNPRLTLGQREEMCQPATNVGVRDSEGSVRKEEENGTNHWASFSFEGCVFAWI